MPYWDTQNNGQPYYNYNLSMAEQILDNAGYTKSYELDEVFYRFNGSTIRIFFNAGNAEREKMSIMFRGALDEIGILSSVIAEGWPQLLHRMYTTDDWDLMFIGWGPDYNDPDDDQRVPPHRRLLHGRPGRATTSCRGRATTPTPTAWGTRASAATG
jgi:ABC-type transport system substrate-binding protein